MTSTQQVIQRFVDKHPRDSARVVGGLSREQAGALLASLETPLAARLVEHVDGALASGSLEVMPPAAAAAITTALPLRVVTAALRRMGQAPRDAVLEALPADRATRLKALLAFAPRTAGALMEPEALAISEDTKVGEALERVRSYANNVAHYLYVTDVGKLKGAVSLRQLLAAPTEATLASVMASEPATLSPHESLEAVLAHSGWMQLVALPVVDDEGTFLGALRFATVRRLERELQQSLGRHRSPQTGRALAELFGLAVSGAMEWPTALLGNTEGTES
jgi:magnesium transporter